MEFIRKNFDFLYRYLSEDELIPVIGDLHPSEHYYAKQQADYVTSEVSADDFLDNVTGHSVPRYLLQSKCQ